MSDIIIIPQIKESEQDNHFIELDCQNTEEDIVTIPPIKEQPECPENENKDNSITVIPQIKECRRHNVTLNVKDLKNLVEAAKQDIGIQLGSLATKQEVQELSDRIPDDVATEEFVYSRERVIESQVDQKDEALKSFVLEQNYTTQTDVNSAITAVLDHVAKQGDNPDVSLTSVQEELKTTKESIILGVGELKESITTDVAHLGQEITEVKNAVDNIDLSTLAKESTLHTVAGNIIDAVTGIDVPIPDLSPLAKEKTLADGIATIAEKVDNIDFTAIAKEETLSQGISDVKNAVANIDLSTVAKEGTLLGTKSLIDGKFGDVFVKFGELTTFIAQKFDWIASFIVTKKDELQKFISDRKLELHNLIAIDILGAINRNHGELQEKTNDILGRQQAYENNAAARAQDTINVVNSQGSQLGKYLDDNKWALMGKVDELRGENSEATMSVVYEELMKLNGSYADQIKDIVGE